MSQVPVDLQKLKEALDHQVEVYAQMLARTVQYNERAWRSASLHPDFEFKPHLETGTGWYSVNKVTGEVCECKMEWFREGTILMCPICFLEGT